MNEPTSLASEAKTREQAEAEATAAREQSARADFTRQFEREGADVGAAELRELRAAAQDLSPTAIWVALDAVGADANKGLAGVPSSKVGAACASLRASLRLNFTT